MFNVRNKYDGGSIGTRCYLLWCVALVVATCAQATAADMLQSFRTEYPAAEVHLEQAYSHVKILATETRNDGVGKFLWKQQEEILRQDNLVRCVRTVVESADAQCPAGTLAALGGSTSEYFSVFKGPGDTAFKFLWFGKKADFDSTVRMGCLPAFASYCILDQRFVDYIAQKNVTVVSAALTRFDAEEAIEVVTELKTPNEGLKKGHFFLQPNTWALLGWILPLRGDQVKNGSDFAWHAKIAYRPGIDRPEVEALDFWVHSPRMGQNIKVDGRQFAIHLVRFGPIDLNLFTLGSLGAKSPATDPVPDSTAPAPQSSDNSVSSPGRPGVANMAQGAIGELEVPVPPDENGPGEMSLVRLMAYGTCAAAIATLGICFGIRAIHHGSK